MAWQNIIPAITGFFGYQGAKNQAAQQAAQNKLLEEQFEYEKGIRAPGVAGAMHQLGAGRWVDAQGNPVAEGTEGATWQSQFQPFVNAAGQQAVAGSNIAQQYLANVPHYQQAGLAGLAGYQGLAGAGPAYQRQLADHYIQNYGRGLFDIAARDINREADRADKSRAVRAGRFGALSSQEARRSGEIDRQRTEALLDAGRRAQDIGYQRAQAELLRRQQLAGHLTALGSAGLGQAQQASQLGSGAQQYGIQAPFLPFQQYGQTIGVQPQVNVPRYGEVTDPFTTGVGLGLKTWNAFNPQPRS